MSRLDIHSSEAIIATCRANSSSLADCLAGCFGSEWIVELPEAAVSIADSAPPPAEPGLIFVFKFATGAAALFWPEATGLLPDWYRESDAAGRGKLTTLAEGLGSLLFPEDAAVVGSTSNCVTDLSTAWKRAAFAISGAVVPLTVTSADRSGTVFLAWQATDPEAMLSESEAEPATKSPHSERGKSAFLSPPEVAVRQSFEESLADLPPYMRSLLRIKVRLTVSLATTRQPVRRIVELGPGSIIQFNKRCDEPLQLRVDGQEIAVGEAVKVGDKFGVRLTSMVLPKERFLPLRQ